MVMSWYTIVSVVGASLLLTFVLWKTRLLHIFRRPYIADHEFHRAKSRAYMRMGKSEMLKQEEKAVFKFDKILELEIPKWMGRPPLSYAICFLIVCFGIAVIVLAISMLV